MCVGRSLGRGGVGGGRKGRVKRKAQGRSVSLQGQGCRQWVGWGGQCCRVVGEQKGGAV